MEHYVISDLANGYRGGRRRGRLNASGVVVERLNLIRGQGRLENGHFVNIANEIINSKISLQGIGANVFCGIKCLHGMADRIGRRLHSIGINDIKGRAGRSHRQSDQRPLVVGSGDAGIP